MITFYDKKFVIFDLETTESTLASARGKYPEIVEVGAVLVDSEFEAISTFTSLVRPDRIDDFTDYSESFTGIKREEVEKAPHWSEVSKDFMEFTKFNGYKLMSWGVIFDYGVLMQEYWKKGMRWPHAYPLLDALSMTCWMASYWGLKFDGWKLSKVCKRLEVPEEGKHRALNGALTVLEVLKVLANLA